MTAWLTVVGIGEDGLDGLGATARAAIAEARVLIGGARHLAMIPPDVSQERLTWPRPFDIAPVLGRRDTMVCVLASGDPMLFGAGAVLARAVPPEEMRVIPAISSAALAAARLGWALQDVPIHSATSRPLAAVLRDVHPGARLLILAADGTTPAALASLLTTHGFGPSRLTVLQNLGGPAEARHDATAATWPPNRSADLCVIALDCRADKAEAGWSCLAGLPDHAFQHDGQLTKRDIRAITLAHLAPRPGQLLWDVGAGSGAIAIEWMRAHPACRAIAIEPTETRRVLIRANSEALGVPSLDIKPGRAPEALAGLPPPDAIFIGGGLTTPGVLDTAWAALKAGGILVANAVTLESEAAMLGARARLGGDLTRIAVAHPSAVGGFEAWRPAMPVTIWRVRKE
jgi:precorrin-6Y C5,15-methyltransferase (decarboxylating)